MMKKEHGMRKIHWERDIGIFVLVTLLASIVYIIIRIALSPSGAIDPAGKGGGVKSDYTLMLLQCILGLVVLFIPAAVERKWSIDIPNYMHIMFYVFLYCAIYLGEVRNFYYLIPFWDTILHAFSAAMLGAMGFSLVSVLNDSKSVNIRLSPFFVAMFAFCFALSAGAVWEIYEFSFDGLLSLNMQKFELADGTMLVGHAALTDTMKDIIVDAASALVISTIGFFMLKKGRLKRSAVSDDDAPSD